jgi:hypothetical protein
LLTPRAARVATTSARSPPRCNCRRTRSRSLRDETLDVAVCDLLDRRRVPAGVFSQLETYCAGAVRFAPRAAPLGDAYVYGAELSPTTCSGARRRSSSSARPRRAAACWPACSPRRARNRARRRNDLLDVDVVIARCVVLGCARAALCGALARVGARTCD